MKLSEEKCSYTQDGREISCAMIIQNKFGDILGCHCTGKEDDEYYTYDLPKGHQKVGEEPIKAAIRECREETGIDLSNRIDDIIDLGVYDYTDEKVLHVFYIYAKIPDIESLGCSTYFTDEGTGKEFPEIDGYRRIRADERRYFFKSIQKILRELEV